MINTMAYTSQIPRPECGPSEFHDPLSDNSPAYFAAPPRQILRVNLQSSVAPVDRSLLTERELRLVPWSWAGEVFPDG